MDMSLSQLWEIVKDREAWRAVVHEVTKRHDLASKEQQQTYENCDCLMKFTLIIMMAVSLT